MNNIDKLEKFVKANFALKNKEGWSTHSSLELNQEVLYCIFARFASRYFTRQMIADQMHLPIESAINYFNRYDNLIKSERVRVKFGLIENKIRLEG